MKNPSCITARRETGYRPGLRSVTSTGGAARICQVLRLAQVLGSRLRDSAGFTPDFPWGQIRGFSCKVNIPRVAADVNAKRARRQEGPKKSYDSAMCPVGLYTGGLGFLAAVALLEKEFTWLGLGNT